MPNQGTGGALCEHDFCIARDGREWVVEVKAHVSWEDVAILKRKAKLYERCRGARPLVAIISPFVDEEARRKAEKGGAQGIHIRGGRGGLLGS